MKKRYDGTLQSLMDKSHKPHSHPNQHTEQELKLISDMRRRNPNAGLVVFSVKLRQRGYTRSVTGFYRVLRKTGLNPKKLPNPKYIPKPYEKMLFPGQRVQIDVKFVPSSCLVGEAKGKKFYHYTALDPTLHATTAKSNVPTEKTMNTFTLITLSIPLMILKFNLLFTTKITTKFPCVLLIGILPLIILILSFSVAKFFNSLFVTHQL